MNVQGKEQSHSLSTGEWAQDLLHGSQVVYDPHSRTVLKKDNIHEVTWIFVSLVRAKTRKNNNTKPFDMFVQEINWKISAGCGGTRL